MRKWLWRIIYMIYPPFLRVLECCQIHRKRQDFHLGFLNNNNNPLTDIKKILLKQGFEDAILAWKDPGEILSMRKIDKKIFQYHLRIFADDEVRGHYEYTSEGNIWGHITEKRFEPAQGYFEHLLKLYIKK